MRQPSNQKRGRGGRSGGRKGNVHSGNRTFESNGPNSKIRGNANQLYEKYQNLARDASAAGDRISAENFLQHAEHYYRIMSQSNGGGSQRSQSGGGVNSHQNDRQQMASEIIPGSGAQPVIGVDEDKPESRDDASSGSADQDEPEAIN